MHGQRNIKKSDIKLEPFVVTVNADFKLPILDGTWNPFCRSKCTNVHSVQKRNHVCKICACQETL